MAQELHAALLRPAILHILRAAGYHSARPSVVDAVSDIAARYMLLLAQRTAYHAWSNHNDADPAISDVRMALTDAGMLVPSMTGAEEAWKELLRHPLEDFPERNGLRLKEQRRRDLEDTADVREFIDWITGPANREIMRIAGLERDAAQGGKGLDAAADANAVKEDYLTSLKKKHSKTGEESRFQGTVLGIPADDRPIRIEGGPPESIHDWIKHTQEKAVAAAKLESEKTAGNGLESAPRSPPDEKEEGDPMDVES
ncbi:bromodomain associated domain protein [Diplodia corticola]|uniref:Bromodomain associated domain protein n=1 Tax=Diplodia corticola TaxID=236234 RepID=A0A1J9RJW2_9PEZI|nr:bromodomain associated domain protein [Diplodia corticola]OJD32859.1 bromodomain associated domain protein [Diplodia corticola]